MKAWKILLTILSSILLLGLLCSFFPRDGVAIGHVTLEFPSLEEVLGDSEPAMPELSPEELIKERLEAISKAERKQYLDYFRNDPARIYFPDDNYRLFDSLFAAFDRASVEPMKIVHYGDSQIEVDRVSSKIRQCLQERFGGTGPGILPLRGEYYNLSVGEKATADPGRYMVFGSQENRVEGNRYGPMAQFSRLDTTLTVSFFSMKNNKSVSRYFNHVIVLAGNITDNLRLSCRGRNSTVSASDATLSRVRFELPDSSTSVSLTLSGHADIYGIQLEGDSGISLDNVPMRGCSGTVFTRISSSQLKTYYNANNVRLIILQYGGNTVPYLNSDKSIEDYARSIKHHIEYLRNLAPDASFLFIGPSDMSTNISGDMQTYPYLPQIVEALKNAALEAGIAFWDMYGAMGGMNSMVQWVNAQPPLAGGDYVHFTPKGAEEMGNMLSRSLMLYYDYYKWRLDHE